VVRRFERSLAALRARSSFRVVEYSIQSNQVHFVIEADGASELGRGMKALGVRFARVVNGVFERRGTVLRDRYHLKILRTPREVRNALAYVLQNVRKHRAQRGLATPPAIDPASSGRWFACLGHGRAPVARSAGGRSRAKLALARRLATLGTYRARRDARLTARPSLQTSSAEPKRRRTPRCPATLLFSLTALFSGHSARALEREPALSSRSMSDDAVALRFATEQDRPLLANLLELYLHDFSETFPLELGPDGRYGYDRLSSYWLEPGRRFPFVIECGGAIAGFALVTRGSPFTIDPNDLDVAEFFVVRRFRRAGVGQRAAFLLWDRLPGHWIVRVVEDNRRGMAFWPRAVGAYTGGKHVESDWPGKDRPWRVFSFRSRTAL
jgi:predicted acetyltransferase